MREAMSQAGFHGKLPARGDFVGLGLPPGFLRPWEDWMQAVMAGSKQLLGEAWLPAWMQAPIWRFLLPAGTCGPAAMVGLWLPSVDRVGRYYPLTIARPLDGPPQSAAPWLEQAEAAGLAALEADLTPEALAARLATPPEHNGQPALLPAMAGHGLWWTLGAQVAPPGGLPDTTTFAAMLNPAASGLMPG